MATARHGISIAAQSRTSLYETFARLPINHMVIVGSLSSGSAMYLIKETSASNMDFTITPDSTSTNSSLRLLMRDRFRTTTTARRPQPRAITCVAAMPHDNRIANAAPNPAPEETPRMSGLTSGFPKTA